MHPAKDMEATVSKRTRIAIALGLVLIAAALFSQTATFEFLNYDDDDYVTKNPVVAQGLSLDGISWAFTSVHASNWHPLTWISHMLDVQLFGMDPGPHHLTSVVLHALSAALLFLALEALTRKSWPSALVALFFAVHPLRAESVAWVAERKDVLSGLFFMTTLLAYARYAREPSTRRHIAVSVSLVLGLLSKPMLVTLPPLLLVLDLWPLQRFESTRFVQLLREKALWFALAIGSAVVTFIVQNETGAVNPVFGLGLEARFSNTFVAYSTYVGQLFWPADLCAIYIHPGLLDRDAYAPWTTTRSLATLLVVGLTLLALRGARRAPMFTTGWLWYLGTAFPVIGLVQVGFQAHADRYTYLPTLGLLVALVFGLDALLRTPRARSLAFASGILACLGLSPLAWNQTSTWANSTNVFERAIAVTRSNFIAHTNLGESYQQKGDLRGALEQYRIALEIRPNLYPVRTNLAQILVTQGRFEEGLRELELALRYEPDYPPALILKALALTGAKQDRPAIETLRHCLRVAPGELFAMNQLAWILATSRFEDLRDPEEAHRLASVACEATNDGNPGFLETKAAAAAARGDFDEATRLQDRALRMLPENLRRPARVRLQLYRQRRAFVQGGP